MEKFFYTFGATGFLTIIMFPLAAAVNFIVTLWTAFLIWLSSGSLLFALPNWVSSETNFIISTAIIQFISIYYIVSIPLYVVVYIYCKKADLMNWGIIFFLPYSMVALLVLLFGGDDFLEKVWGAFCLLAAALVSYFRFKSSWLPKLTSDFSQSQRNVGRF